MRGNSPIEVSGTGAKAFGSGPSSTGAGGPGFPGVRSLVARVLPTGTATALLPVTTESMVTPKTGGFGSSCGGGVGGGSWLGGGGGSSSTGLTETLRTTTLGRGGSGGGGFTSGGGGRGGGSFSTTSSSTV